jgi:hypothetical protein
MRPSPALEQRILGAALGEVTCERLWLRRLQRNGALAGERGTDLPAGLQADARGLLSPPGEADQAGGPAMPSAPASRPR